MRQVEVWQAVAVSDEFLKVLEDIPEVATQKGVYLGGKYIEGARCVMTARSMQEIEQNLPVIVEKLTDAKHTHLKIVHKLGHCFDCELKDGEDPNIPSTDCPHILKGECYIICQSWIIDTKTLQKVAV